MNDMNHIGIIGRLTKDLGGDGRSFAYLPSGQARATVSIAVNRSKKTSDGYVDEVSYFDVDIWGKTAENLKPYLTKGKQIAIDGHLKQDRWENNGQKFSKIKIVADSVQLLGGRDGQQQSTPRYQQRDDVAADAYNGDEYSEGQDFPEDLPF